MTPSQGCVGTSRRGGMLDARTTSLKKGPEHSPWTLEARARALDPSWRDEAVATWSALERSVCAIPYR